VGRKDARGPYVFAAGPSAVRDEHQGDHDDPGGRHQKRVPQGHRPERVAAGGWLSRVFARVIILVFSGSPDYPARKNTLSGGAHDSRTTYPPTLRVSRLRPRSATPQARHFARPFGGGGVSERGMAVRTLWLRVGRSLTPRRDPEFPARVARPAVSTQEVPARHRRGPLLPFPLALRSRSRPA